MADTYIAPQEVLEGFAQESMPVLETIVGMQVATAAYCTLDERTYHLVRLAALVAVNAPPVSYLVSLGLAAEAGVTIEDAQGVLVAIAPIVGATRLTAAAGNVLRGLGLGAALSEQSGADG